MFSRSILNRIFTINRKQVSSCFSQSTSTPIEHINSEKKNINSEEKENKLSGFAKAYEKHVNIENFSNSKKEPSFATLLRNSKFIDLGDPRGRIVSGTIFHVVQDDLYIDFGWKFHCVCSRPSKNASDYVRGAKVRLRINDLELSTKFLGYEKDLTLLEADATLLGLLYSPVRSKAYTSETASAV